MRGQDLAILGVRTETGMGFRAGLRGGQFSQVAVPRIIRIDRRDSDGNRTGEILVERTRRGWTVAPSNK